MAMKLENINNLIADDLAKRNENWTEIDNTLELKANKQQEAWITPTFLSGHTGTLQYRKNQFGFVEFKGSISNNGVLGSMSLQLPIGYKPPYQIWKNFTNQSNLGGNNITTKIDLSGNITMYNTTGTIDLSDFSFEGV